MVVYSEVAAMMSQGVAQWEIYTVYAEAKRCTGFSLMRVNGEYSLRYERRTDDQSGSGFIPFAVAFF